jgi:hypothetical protein
MNSNIVELVKQGIEAAGGSSWQYQAGLAAAGVAMGVLGSVGAWIGKQIYNKHKAATPPEGAK